MDAVLGRELAQDRSRTLAVSYTHLLNGSGTATYFFSTLGVGTHIISGVYSPGSPDFTGSSATAVSQSVIATLLSASIAGTPTKVYDGTTTATLNATNFTLTGFAGSDGAIITQTTGTYAAATAGAQTVTASLSSSNFTANGSTNFANYVLCLLYTSRCV